MDTDGAINTFLGHKFLERDTLAWVLSQDGKRCSWLDYAMSVGKYGCSRSGMGSIYYYYDY